MITDDDLLRCTNRQDLLALPAAMFGFIPEESLVLLRMVGQRVEFAARVDLIAVLENPQGLLSRIFEAENMPGRSSGGWLLLGYSETIESYVPSLLEFGELLNSQCFVTDGRTSWVVADGALGDAQPYDLYTTATACAAVFRGRMFGRTREDLVSTLPVPNPDPGLLDDARKTVEETPREQQLELLRSLVMVVSPTPKQSALLATLLIEEECFAELISQLSVERAGGFRASLELAMKQAGAAAQPNTAALLALAYWLEGSSALENECLDKLEKIEPAHPLGLALRRFQALAIPPALWDCA